jgi:hypothetical protein
MSRRWRWVLDGADSRPRLRGYENLSVFGSIRRHSGWILFLRNQTPGVGLIFGCAFGTRVCVGKNNSKSDARRKGWFGGDML